MNFYTFALFATLAAVALSDEITALAGTKPDGETCTLPMECIEPLYCLRISDTEHACGKKPCDGRGECRIGQFCDKAGFCAAPTCSKDSECSGATVCQTNGKCGTKSSAGQVCTKDSQCWSGKCFDRKCTRADGGAPSAETDDDDDQGIVDAVEDKGSKLFRLGGGGIAGIVIGSLLLLSLCCLCLFCCRNVSNRGDK